MTVATDKEEVEEPAGANPYHCLAAVPPATQPAGISTYQTDPSIQELGFFYSIIQHKGGFWAQDHTKAGS